MGRLITKSDLFEIYDMRKHRIDAAWYIIDARKQYGTEHYSFDWPSRSFPYFVSLHNRVLNNDNKIKIRQWIEANLVETIICDREFIHNDDYSYIFHFEHEHSVTAFKLAFIDLITAGSSRHFIEEANG